jgi:hypothetical protein
MNFWEKWYWANYLKGTNPITTFIRGLVFGIWIPFLLSAILCFFIDPQWKHKEGLAQWSLWEYIRFYGFFWKTIVFVTCQTIYQYATYAWNHMGTIARFWQGHPG